MSLKILIVEDNQAQAQQMSSALKEYGFAVEVDCAAEDAIATLQVINFDVVISDLDLPMIDGLNFMQQVRNLSITTPIIVVSGLKDEKKKLASFQHADDYIEKPYSSKELILRIMTVRRRYSGFASSIISLGNLSINTFTKVAMVHGKSLHLTRKEYLILELMMLRKGSLICKEIFLDIMYNNVEEEPVMKILDVYNFKLRKKLKFAGADVTIVTLWGRGSMLMLKSELKKNQGSLSENNNMEIEDADMINENVNKKRRIHTNIDEEDNMNKNIGSENIKDNCRLTEKRKNNIRIKN